MKKVSVLLSVFLLLMFGCSNEVSTDKSLDDQAEESAEESTEESAIEEKEDTPEDISSEKDEETEVESNPIIEEIETNSAYLTEIGSYMDELSNYMYDFSSLNFEVADNPHLISDESWIMDIVTTLLSMQDVIDNVRALEVPKAHEEQYNVVLKAMDQYEFVIENYPDAIDNMDVTLINECAVAMENGTKYIEEASTMFD